MLSNMTPLFLVAAAAFVAASPTPVGPVTDGWTWDITRFTSTCTAATCRYDFNISGPVGPGGQPSFDAYGCDGTSVQGDYKGCATVGLDVPGNVLAREYNLGIHDSAIVSIQYTFLNKADNLVYTYTGNGTASHTNGGEPFDFHIFPSQVAVIIPDRK